MQAWFCGYPEEGTACCHRPQVLLCLWLQSLSGSAEAEWAPGQGWQLAFQVRPCQEHLWSCWLFCGDGCSQQRGARACPTSALTFFWRVPPCAGWSAGEATSAAGALVEFGDFSLRILLLEQLCICPTIFPSQEERRGHVF